MYIRKCFTSRWPDGVLLELDFKQLEVFVLAYLSNDKVLRRDLLSGKDLHAISATSLFGSRYTDKQRTIAKQLSFQLQYGAKAKGMAHKLGIPVHVATRFIKQYYDRYPGVKAYQDAQIALVKSNRQISDRTTATGIPIGFSQIQDPNTNRIYTFWERENRYSPTGVSFNENEIKNYRVQGLATGDIVPMIEGKLYRALKKDAGFNSHIKFVNPVHDSVLFDCSRIAYANVFACKAKEIMEKAPQYLKEEFDMDFDLPLKVDVKMGKNWAEMESLDI